MVDIEMIVMLLVGRGMLDFRVGWFGIKYWFKIGVKCWLIRRVLYGSRELVVNSSDRYFICSFLFYFFGKSYIYKKYL